MIAHWQCSVCFDDLPVRAVVREWADKLVILTNKITVLVPYLNNLEMTFTQNGAVSSHLRRTDVLSLGGRFGRQPERTLLPMLKYDQCFHKWRAVKVADHVIERAFVSQSPRTKTMLCESQRQCIQVGKKSETIVRNEVDVLGGV